MPEGTDPDDFVRKNGIEDYKNLLKEKKIIQSFIWNFNLKKINKNNPFEISTFEKEIKKLAYSIKDEVLKKYVLEEFLQKLNNLTPLQTSRQIQRFSKFTKKKNIKILEETKNLHKKKKNLSKTQILEFSILFIILNYTEIASKKIEELSELHFISEKNELLKSTIIKLIYEGNDKIELEKKVDNEYKNLVKEINENSNIQLIIKNKDEQAILALIDELITELKEQNSLRKMESLEKKLINSLDEAAFSELIKLKSQLNRE